MCQEGGVRAAITEEMMSKLTIFHEVLVNKHEDISAFF